MAALRGSMLLTIMSPCPSVTQRDPPFQVPQPRNAQQERRQVNPQLQQDSEHLDAAHPSPGLPSLPIWRSARDLEEVSALQTFAQLPAWTFLTLCLVFDGLVVVLRGGFFLGVHSYLWVFFVCFNILFIYSRERERERQRQAEGEAGSMQGA